ncbi:hypothetical protein [Streptomyces lunaelactis]|uniref:hypothetical protein n=1 Tax=Streptomyces lunaelactis TaxID=1535768 RepID=UPI0015845C8C|nr:hypothetical protein [Streptomyces lunaelactis]NUL13266.1 hypothetical protein [Streptomyces lunaelactis]
MSAPRALARLAQAVKARRLEVHPSRLAAAQAAGVSKDTWQRVEDGLPVRDVSYAKMESVLGWALGSCVAVAEGGEPVSVKYVEGGGETAMVSQIPAAWLEGELQEAIQSSAMATTPNLTVREIRDLSDKVVEELRKRGILPSAS